jgi:CheY-like chemotaxis protein
MPGMNGHELAARIRERSPDTHVLFVSGYTGKDAKLESGARFLAKPFTPSELLQEVQSLLT